MLNIFMGRKPNHTSMIKFHILFFCLLFHSANGQMALAVDSMKTELSKAKTATERVKWLSVLSRTLMNVNLSESEKYGKQLIEEAEESRDRELMIKAYLANGERCGYFQGSHDYTNRAINYYIKALDIAKQNQLNRYVVASLKDLASIHLSIPDVRKAEEYIGKASSAISVLDNDSLKVIVLQTEGDVNLARNAKIEALRFYLSSLRTAEQIEDPGLIRNSYVKLSNFYSRIEDYDKAIDYMTIAMKQLDKIHEKNSPYQRVIDVNSLGNLYAAKKNYEMAIKYHERSLKMADSLNFSNLKIPAYVSLLNQYLRMDQPQKALQYFNSKEGRSLQAYLRNFGLTGVIDQAYGVIYTEIGKFDSARIYFKNADEYFEEITNELFRMNHYVQVAGLYKKTEEPDKAIELLLKVKEIAERTGQLEAIQRSAKELDSLYMKTGKLELSKKYNSIYYLYKDSIEKLNKEKELAQVEAQDEQERQKKLEEALAEKKRRRNNIQYLAITIGIAAFFIVLVFLGMFKVSEGMIKAIGFFVFIMLFEFIFLVFKKKIAVITNGEPLKDLFFMIGLAALLLPLHHWLEHRVIKFLTSHNRLTAAGQHLKTKIFKRSRRDSNI